MRVAVVGVLLARLADDYHALAVSMCHLIGDGWSAHVLLHGLGAVPPAPLPGPVPGCPE
ncbi:hypothetical protein WEI85_42885 [Actinomycetes bacterium KLBMP 9797]